MDVPTPIDSQLNVDGRLSESPLPTYDGVPVSSSLSRYVVGCWWEGQVLGWSRRRGRDRGEGWVPAFAGTTIGGSPLRWDGGEGERGWVPAPYQVRGRLFAGTTIGGSPLRWDRGEGEGDGFPPRIRYGAGFSRERRMGGRPYGGREGRERDRGEGWVPAPYQVRGRLFAGTTVGGSPLWIPAPYRGTGQGFRGKDGWGGVVKCGACMLGWRRWYCTWLGCMT